jgi:putative phosphoesterase
VIAIVSDTHMPRGSRELPARCVELLEAAELIVHAGDFSGAEILDRFEAFGVPLVAVKGNVEDAEVRRRLPERAVFEWQGHRVGVIHDAGPKDRRLERLRAAFPDADAVVFGHSHIPLHEQAADGFQIFNPGSPTERRRSPERTMGTLELAGVELRFAHVGLGLSLGQGP